MTVGDGSTINEHADLSGHQVRCRSARTILLRCPSQRHAGSATNHFELPLLTFPLYSRYRTLLSNHSTPQIIGNRVVFGSGVSIGAGTVLLPSAYMAPEAQVADGRIVGALATSMHPTKQNRYGLSSQGHCLFLPPFIIVTCHIPCEAIFSS